VRPVIANIGNFAAVFRARARTSAAFAAFRSAPASLRAAQRRGNPVARLDCFATLAMTGEGRGAA
jgi:hypothetical protein